MYLFLLSIAVGEERSWRSALERSLLNSCPVKEARRVCFTQAGRGEMTGEEDKALRRGAEVVVDGGW